MAFPDAPRVIYEKNPLEEVICQLRFPTVLKIDAGPPAAFQERIRGSYPFYKLKPTFILPAGEPAELANLIGGALPFGVGQAAHEFASRDGNWIFSLTREFVALTCRRYERWELFKDRLREPLGAVQELYSPSFFTRIGLRYRDVVRRSVLGLERVGWIDLLQPWVAGPLASGLPLTDVERTGHEMLIRLPDGHGRVQVHHGLVEDPTTKEQCYLIDADFYNDQQTEPPHALERLDFLNTQSRLFFRWCVRERLHQAMVPELLSGD